MAIPPETLASYVPALVARRFTTDPTPLTAPVADRFPAAVLFADITGYTTLAGRLAQYGPAGAEELIRLLNAYFGRLIDIVMAHGGDIIKFAGDAALVLWPAIDEPLAIVTQRAAQCGLDTQLVLGQYQVADGLRLSLRVGIGAGEVLTASVGGVFRRWEFMVAGPPLAQIGAAQRQAQPGQVVLSPEAWELVQDRGDGVPLGLMGGRDGEVPPDAFVLLRAVRDPLRLRPLARVNPPPESEVALRGYIPGAILSRLGAGQTEWLSELRRVTVVFLNVTGLDYAAPGALDQVQTTMHALQTALYHYEGSVNQFIVDDKGTTLVAAFGLPPLTHEDDAVRGVQAAMMMQAKLNEIGVQGAIGVTTGQVYSGERGNALRREYAMVGDVVNMAARLMQAAAKYKGASVPILCDEATCHAAQARLVFDDLPPITVKGKSEPIAVYRPRGPAGQDGLARAPAHRTTTMIGRAAERAMLTERLQSLLRGQAAGVVVIEGEVGIGKSQLVDDLLRQARVMDVRCLVGAGDAIEKSTPYHAWRKVFSQLLGLETLAGPEARRARIRSMLESSPGLLRLAPLLNAVLPLDWPDNEVTGPMYGAVRADNTRDLLLRLLQMAIGPVPTLLILEDAHWMDSASWLLALAAGQPAGQRGQGYPLLLIMATRPLTGSLPEEYRQLLLLTTGMQWLRLDALPPQDILALVCQRLGVATLPEPVAALIHEKAQGNPFFSEELAYALRDAGYISIADGECRIAPDAGDLSALSLPDTVQGAITSRMDRLMPAQQLTLKVASVIGRAFNLRLLCDIYPIEADKTHLADHLASLQQLDLISLEASGSQVTEADPVYAFKSIVIQETAYNLMLFAQRRQLHRAVAEWHERNQAGDSPTWYPLLAHHWSKAVEDPQADPALVAKAIDYLEKAGEQAVRDYANQEAVRFFEEALALDERWAGVPEGAGREPAASSEARALRRARWERQLGEAHLSLGHLAESGEHLERAVALLGRPAPVMRLEVIVSLAKQIAFQALHRARLYFKPRALARAPAASGGASISDRRAALRHPQTVIENLEAARAYWALGQVYFYANEKILNIHANLYSLNLAEAAGPSPELARSYASMCITAGLVRQHRLARAYGQWARETAQQAEHSPSLLWAWLVTAVYDAGIGHWEQARQALGQAVELANRRGDRRRWEQSLNTLATVACLQGEFVGIASLFADLYESARRRRDAQYQVYGLLGQARCLLPVGKIDQALALLEMVETLRVGNLGRVEEIYAYGLWAMARLRQGQRPLARSAADKASQLIAQSLPISYNLLFAYAGVAEVYLALWEQAISNESADPTIKSEISELRACAGRACKALHQFARVFPIGQPDDGIYQGWYEWLAGHHAQARAAWQRGLAAAERLAMPYEQALAYYEIGRHVGGAERQERLARAREILTRLGAVYDLARVEAALAAG